MTPRRLWRFCEAVFYVAFGMFAVTFDFTYTISMAVAVLVAIHAALSHARDSYSHLSRRPHVAWFSIGHLNAITELLHG